MCMFWGCITLLSFIITLPKIEEFATNRDMRICGYYHANEYYNDKDVSIETKPTHFNN